TDSSRLEKLGITKTDLGGDSDTAGTPVYMAPERLQGKLATVRGDIYSFGVILYQLVVGDLSRVVAPGWQREIEDDLLKEDIASCVDGSPERRPGDAIE